MKLEDYIGTARIIDKVEAVDSLGKETTWNVLDKMPIGYVVWNIGRHNISVDGLVPICREKGDGIHIIWDSVVAIRMDPGIADIVMDEAGHKKLDKEAIRQIKRRRHG